jgi:hypothetical protein
MGEIGMKKVWLALCAGLFFAACVQPGGPGNAADDERTSGQTDETAKSEQREPERIGYTVEANGENGAEDSTALLFFFDRDVADLSGDNLLVVNDTGVVVPGEFTGAGKNWSLALTVAAAGNVKVAIRGRSDIEGAEKNVAVYQAGTRVVLSWTAEADGEADRQTSTFITFTFSGAVAELLVGDISITGGAAYPVELMGGGSKWYLMIGVAEAGVVTAGINRDGIEGGTRSITVHRAPEAPEEEERVKIGISILSLPEITIYGRNQTFDPTGLRVAWEYNDGLIEEIPAGGYACAEPNMAKYSPQMLTVSAGGYTAAFSIRVVDSDRTLTSITVSGNYKTDQVYYRDFDKTGLVITVNYSDGTSQNVTSYAGISGYNKTRRGPQDVVARLNGRTAPIPGIRVRIPADMPVTMPYGFTIYAMASANYRRTYVKGESIDFAHARFQPTATTVNGKVDMKYMNGGILDTDTVTGYDPHTPGPQTATLHLDDVSVEFKVAVVDVEPAAWFDYGYRRTPDDPGGKGPGGGKYYARPGETLTLAPTRFLVGYDRSHQDTGASYSWSVAGGSFSSPSSATGEFYNFTPTAPGTTLITVQVTGNNYVTGQPITVRATTEVECYTGTVEAEQPFVSPLLLPGPGQYASGGSGYGWTLGSGGGYEVWRVDQHQDSYKIQGNGFGGWVEPGVIWIQEDRNGNNIPDEMWYELTGSEDAGFYRDWLRRRYAITYIDTKGADPIYWNESLGERGRQHYIYWVDSMGRADTLGSSWPAFWPPDRITYTFTLVRDPGGPIPYMGAGPDTIWGYVDTLDEIFPINRAIRADGAPIELTAVRFIKVATATFDYINGFNDRSTEIYYADGIGRQSYFPLPGE